MGLVPMQQSAVLFCELVLGGVFLMSAVGKWRDMASFRGSLEAFGVPSRGPWPARSLVIAELVVAASIAWPRTRQAGFVSAALLLVILALSIGRVVRRGAEVRCHCFGTESAPLRAAHVGRNIVLAALGAVAALASLTYDGNESIGFGESVLVVVLALMALALIALFDDFLELLSPARGRPLSNR